MAKEDVKEKVKRKIKELKERKKLGEVKIPGVSSPKKKKVARKDSDKRAKQKQAVIVGPRGGKYVETRGGKKKYDAKDKLVKSILEEIKASQVVDFIKNFKKGK